MEIIVKKFSSSNRFRPGYNRALGKDIRSAREYVSELNRRGLEPYNKDARIPESKPYVMSKKGHEIVQYIKKHTNKHGNVKLSSRLVSEIGKYLPKKQ